MNIYIDESGSFVSSPSSGSWSVVAALAVPECEERTLGECLAALKAKNDCALENELKIHKVAEDSYVEFLAELGTLK